MYIYGPTILKLPFQERQIVQCTTLFCTLRRQTPAHGRLTDQTLSQIFYKKTLCDFANLCEDSSDLNKCKGGDLVSQKILESGVGTAWEVAR